MSLPTKFKDSKICCRDGTYPVHSVLMAVHSNFLAKVLATVPFHVQHMLILPDFSIVDIKTLCSVMYGSEKTGYVEANLVKSLGFLHQKSVLHGSRGDIVKFGSFPFHFCFFGQLPWVKTWFQSVTSLVSSSISLSEMAKTSSLLKGTVI